jgi:hypothetical protein
MKMKILSGMMFSAISQVDDPSYQDKGFLNRKTGEVVFLLNHQENAEGVVGEAAAAAMAADRADVAASPDDWIEIPKYYGRMLDDDDGAERFIGDFLEEHGIEAEWR